MITSVRLQRVIMQKMVADLDKSNPGIAKTSRAQNYVMCTINIFPWPEGPD